MLLEKICVIGIGTIGGFLVANLINLKSLKVLSIIDYDIVEHKNIKNSIYNFSDIAKFKIDALETIIKTINKNIVIIKLKEKYKEGITKLPESDLVIDCRDYNFNRNGEIDIRFYISEKKLICDCRKKVDEENYEGKYILEMPEDDLKKAAFHAFKIIDNESFDILLKEELIYYTYLSYYEAIKYKTIKKNISDFVKVKQKSIDIIYDIEISRKLTGLESAIDPIIEINKKRPIKIFISGEGKFQHLYNNISKYKNLEKTIENNKLPIKFIKTGILKNEKDIINCLTKLTEKRFGNFVVTIENNNISLMKNTAGA